MPDHDSSPAAPSTIETEAVPIDESLHQLGLRLAKELKNTSPAEQGINLLEVTHSYERRIAAAYDYFRRASKDELVLSYASEWILDNYYLIRQAIEQIREDLPKGYYQQLPKMVDTPFQGFPRVYAIVHEWLSYSQLKVDITNLEEMLQVFQDHTPLTMGEIWAVPIFLRVVSLEALTQTLEEIIRSEPKLRSPAPTLHFKISKDEVVANCVIGLRLLANYDWKTFFEKVSLVNRTLSQDPSGVYPGMDFKTRDLYRKAVETITVSTGLDENLVALKAVQLANQGKHILEEQDGKISQTMASRLNHVGYYLIAEGKPLLEKELGFQPAWKQRLTRWMQGHTTTIYLGSIFLLTALLIGVLLWYAIARERNALQGWAVLVALFIPGLTITVSLVNWLATLLVPPRSLPKLEFTEKIPDNLRTLVIIPALLTDTNEITSLASQLEMHYLRNPEQGLYFGLLTDFGDAKHEYEPGDEVLVQQVTNAIKALNQKYNRPDQEPVFSLFHRRRLWNPAEGVWMGWERKRGKLHELNLLLRGNEDLTFTEVIADEQVLKTIHFVITLDADTQLPRETASRLVGTMGHPLNRAVFDRDTNKVTYGYTILQPRMEISPSSSDHSWFTRIFAGDAGLDLYTLAVSDVYQDLFGEGSYVGKGIYDVDAFERSVSGHIPENTLLSHDLLEGLLGRAGLITDVTMVEDYPPNYMVQVHRVNRWIRGDWQLSPWLLSPGRFNVIFDLIDRWKIFDNLRRSLLTSGLLLLFIMGWLYLPGSPYIWTVVALLTLGIPVLTTLIMGAEETFSGEVREWNFRPLGLITLRWLLAVAFLPFEAMMHLGSIVVTLYRLLVSHRNLLKWVSVAQSILTFAKQEGNTAYWQMISTGTVLALISFASIMVVRPGSLPPALPVLLLWLVSPEILRLINRPVVAQMAPLSQEQQLLLRDIARHTWSFFEQFVGPDDHWLPPDHYQEVPLGIVAHRTSPTNIGLLFTSSLAAWDLGYIDQFNLITRLGATFDTLEKLERYRGHFLNWYDTRTLQPLGQRYVSSVDSGNLAACLITIAQACREMPKNRIFRRNRWAGYLDTLHLLDVALANHNAPPVDIYVRQIQNEIADVTSKVRAVVTRPDEWYRLFAYISGPFWQKVTDLLGKIVSEGGETLTPAMLRGLLQVSRQVELSTEGVERTINDLAPWIPLLENLPEAIQPGQASGELGELVRHLQEILQYSPELGHISDLSRDGRETANRMKDLLGDQPGSQEAGNWLDQLIQGLTHASGNAGALLVGYSRLADQAEAYVRQMDFTFLYNQERRVFHIGYNLDADLLDNSYYDLLASESRITSIIAIAKGDINQQHWLHLNRPLTLVEGMRVLLSWSGTMFEYLMPPLFLRSYYGTLLDESVRGTIKRQIQFARSKKVPWGISECGYYRFDANQNYQYRAFGVPGLGLKRGLDDDLVITPYASIMTAPFDPLGVYQNAVDLMQYGLYGMYGFYEAIDFTPSRMAVGQKFGLVQSYMTHHQGMILLGLDNYLNSDIMVRRTFSDPRIESTDLLLQEQIPYFAPVQNPDEASVTGAQRLISAPTQIQPWQVPVHTSIPEVHLLSNGQFNTIISNSGSGFCHWKDWDLTRWRSDETSDPWGVWIYLQDLAPLPEQEEAVWSIGNQPIPDNRAELSVVYFPYMANFRRMQNQIVASMEVTVPPDDNVEIRRIQLSNLSKENRTLRLTSYGEVILADQEADIRHPAFNKLFIESEHLPDLNLLVFTRRPRSDNEERIFLGHMLVPEYRGAGNLAVETNRSRFLGRGRNYRAPAALVSPEFLSGETGATLDPVFAIGQELTFRPHGRWRGAYLTFAASSREELLNLARRYQDWGAVERAFQQASISSETLLRKQELDSNTLRVMERVLSGLLYPTLKMRAAPDIIASNQLGQQGLWPYGISGDFPILLVKITDVEKLEIVRQSLQAHRYWRDRGIMIDLVIVNEQQIDYGAELNGLLYRLVARTNSDNWLNQRGGIFILYENQVKPEEMTLLETAARVVLDSERGPLQDQVPPYAVSVPHLPEFVSSRHISEVREETPALPPPGKLLFANGYGGFSEDGKEYVIDFKSGQWTPAPWSNVIGYPDFGFLVTESGSSCTWSINSGENRLSPWLNDPVSDPTGEAIYLRDEETGVVWTPTPLPGGDGQPYRVHHGAGYTFFEHNSQGLKQTVRMFASPKDPVKIVQLRLENTWDRVRRITVTQYIEWVMGTTRSATQQYIIPEYVLSHEALLASNPYNSEFSERVAFLAASKKLHGLTADRVEFIGRNGTLDFPVALRRIGPEVRVTPGEDPCAVLQVHIDLPPGAVEEVYFLIGEGDQRQHALDLIECYHDPQAVQAAWQETQAFWDKTLSAVQVQTPDPAIDLMVNRWLLYQTLSCRIWGRTAFYQSSGAYGFRDQLQDVMALLPTRPEIAREQILKAAAHQFEAGDVLHWWHPPSGRGVRTRISDDLLFLPFVVSEYLLATGDTGLLDEKVPFLQAPPLAVGEDERYGFYSPTSAGYSILDHCRRAIEKGSTQGPNGLPLIGTGDWNDGLNRVGIEGKGESIWLGWFLCDVLERFANMEAELGNQQAAAALKDRAAVYARSIEEHAWDGRWYRRAYYDDGAPLGSEANRECKIDTIAQSWAIISRAGDPDRSRQAIGSVREMLVQPDNRLLLLFTPPFDTTPRDPGYIKAYVPGIRENGGQYTHASIWAAWAYAQLGEGDQAAELLALLNPIYQADQQEKVEIYKTEPYVVAADIYSTPPHVRRGGWTWYTGSSGWLYRTMVEATLGLKRRGNFLVIDPVIPAGWDTYRMVYQTDETTFTIVVKNPEHVCQGVGQVRLNGNILPDHRIPLRGSEKENTVEITLTKK